MYHALLRQYFYRTALILLSGSFLSSASSCNTAKRVAYFQDISDSVSNKPFNLHVATYTDPVILPGDIVAITVQTLDTEVNGLNTKSIEPINSHIETVSLTSQNFNHHPVDKGNNIYIPVLGKISTEGLSTSMLGDSVRVLATKYFKNPIVTVRLVNFTVTVLGEVTKPGSYILPNERATVIDALGMAGDMTIYGRKDNVLLMRNKVDGKLAARLDLNSTRSLCSKYFYLRQGDVIFIEADKAKITALKDGYKTRNYALIASGLSVLIILLSRLTF